MSKKILFSVLSVFCLFFSCNDDDNVIIDGHDVKPLQGYIKMCYRGGEVLYLTDIDSAYYLDGNTNPMDTLGIMYIGFGDTIYHTHLNSVSLYVSKKGIFDGAEFIYSEPGSNSGSSYISLNDTLNPLQAEISDNDKLFSGRFSGLLFCTDTMKVDSCIFHIEKNKQISVL